MFRRVRTAEGHRAEWRGCEAVATSESSLSAFQQASRQTLFMLLVSSEMTGVLPHDMTAPASWKCAKLGCCSNLIKSVFGLCLSLGNFLSG